MPPIAVPPHETGKIRVFALSMPDADARSLSEDPMAQAEALGVRRINPAQVEIFPLSDLDSFGLTGYLREGNDVAPEQIDRDRAKLSALEGWVMIVYSAAFETRPQSLQPAPVLTLIGSYDAAGASTPLQPPLAADAARPYSGVAQNTPATPPRGTAGNTMIGIAVLMVLGLLLWWWLG